MCERFFLKDAWRNYAAPLIPDRDRQPDLALSANFNIAPKQEIPIIAMQNSVAEIGMCHWGYVPSWTDELPRYRMFNIQSESVRMELIVSDDDIGARCLIPASGYYEWVEVKEDEFIPYCVTLPSSEPFFMAGICAKNTKLGMISCAILTTGTQDESGIGKLAHRAPLIPVHGIYFDWLDPMLGEDDIRALISQNRTPELVAYQVGDAVNDKSENGPELINPRRDTLTFN